MSKRRDMSNISLPTIIGIKASGINPCSSRNVVSRSTCGQAETISQASCLDNWNLFISSVQFSLSVMSDSLWPHGLQHTRPPCQPPAPGIYPNSYALSQWCHPTISSSVIPFSSCLQSFPTSEYFQMNQHFWSGGQSIGVSASTSVLPMNIQDWSSLGWTGWISLQSKGLSKVFSNISVKKHQFFST